jgi:DNA-directed RNA polymerase specialized sigma24 family protein
MNHSVEGTSSWRESVTEWLGRLKTGDQAAGQQLWQRYLDRLVQLAGRKLGSTPRTMADEEDVVLSAFHAFLQGVADQRFPRLADRDDLWQVLIMLTERKAVGLLRREHAEKRGGYTVHSELGNDNADRFNSDSPLLARLIDKEPTPEFAIQFSEEFEQRLASLGDEELERIALDKLAGYSNQEVAERRKCCLRTIQRQLKLIRRIWDQDSPP